MSPPSIRIYKIAYDTETIRSVEFPYLLLDNSSGEQDWYELWPIMRFLEENELEEDVWYGFVSPKFPEKANLTYPDIVRIIERNADRDVALFSYDWPSLAYWQNPWISGDRWHSGLIQCMEKFLASQGEIIDLSKVWTDFDTSVLSNFIVAKKKFWLEWRNLARTYYDYVEAGGSGIPDNRSTLYRGTDGYHLKTFVQERLANWILLTSRFSVARPNYAFEVSLAPFVGQDKDSLRIRVFLAGCNLSKKLVRRTGMHVFARIYRRFHRSARRAKNRLKSRESQVTP